MERVTSSDTACRVCRGLVTIWQSQTPPKNAAKYPHILHTSSPTDSRPEATMFAQTFMNEKGAPLMATAEELPAPQFQIPEWLLPHVGEACRWPAFSTPQKQCIVAVCDRARISLGLCKQHYHAFCRRIALREGVSVAKWLGEHRSEAVWWPAILHPELVCWVEACDRSARKNGLCKSHGLKARHYFGKNGKQESANVAPPSDSVTTP